MKSLRMAKDSFNFQPDWGGILATGRQPRGTNWGSSKTQLKVRQSTESSFCFFFKLFSLFTRSSFIWIVKHSCYLMLLWSWSNFHSFLQICQNAILTSNSDLHFTWFDENDQGSTLITLSNTQTNEKMVAQKKNDNLVWTLQSWRCTQRTTETAEVGAGTKSFCRPLFPPLKTS